MGWFDVHAHVTHPTLRPRQDAILENARQAGLTTILANGLNPTDNLAVQKLARRDPLVRPCFGFYPVDVVLDEMEALGVEYPRDSPACSMDEGIAWVGDHVHDAFAVGEIGLDGYWVPEALWEKQEQAFRALVSIAMEADKAVIIHTRKRERRAFEILTEMGATRVNWHCFGSRVKLARRIAEAGHWLSIPANARRNEAFTRMLATLPREKVLLETDCPYLGPEKGVDNEPANVAGTAAFAAELWDCPLESVQRQLEENFEALFHARP
ncbi:MAG: TatD family hydrolase [Myxococcota bacterium]